MEANYYIYVYLDPLKHGVYKYGKFNFGYEPFYIGLGRKNRINKHISESKYVDKYSKHKTAKHYKILKILNSDLEPVRYKLYENITKYSACRLEKSLIKLIGRRDLKLGTLTNLTDGGDGTTNILLSDVQKKHISEHTKEMWISGIFDDRDFKGVKNPFYEKKHTIDTLNKIRETIGVSRKGKLNSNFGIEWSDEQKNIASIRQQKNHKHLWGDNNPAKRKEVREKISETKMGLKNPNAKIWELISPIGEKIIIEGGIKRELPKYGLTYTMMRWVVDNGKYYSKCGWEMHRKEK